MNQLEQIDIVVKYSAGAYTTNQVRGQRSSSTTCARVAAESLGRKVFGRGFQRAERLHDISAGTERWRLHGVAEHAGA
ncbi:MAG: hypothetical protein KIT35_21955 [Piscinibacter sp.]|uniref:hypothetical protein n=1 Tax=Piscinibacter sp. TaxID=1903157 RepID=UPI00258B3496|nr:hypothetical protein [Piscinibacter sp.]MCW5666505.1 hypothetical protein [Piscinibacter sp.]